MGDEVLVEQAGGVAVITLNRPAAMNAVNAALATALGAALDAADADTSIAAIVLTGAGDRAFSAGMDLKAFAAGESPTAPAHPEWGFAGLVTHRIDKPVIAAVNGLALGGGLELVLAADLAIAGRSAKLGFPEVTRGLLAGAGGLIRLPRQVPRKLALEAILTGTPMSAERAYEIGLLNRVVDDGEVLGAAVALATTIAANAPLSVRASKAFIRDSARYGSDWDDEVWAAQTRVVGQVESSEDAKEGPRAFAEKRPPRWAGR